MKLEGNEDYLEQEIDKLFYDYKLLPKKQSRRCCYEINERYNLEIFYDGIELKLYTLTLFEDNIYERLDINDDEYIEKYLDELTIFKELILPKYL